MLQEPDNGKKTVYPDGAILQPFSTVIDEKTITLWVGSRKFAEMTYQVDAEQTPFAIDAKFQDRQLLGIYKWDGKRLQIRLNDAAAGRAKDFRTGSVQIALDLERYQGSTIGVMDADGGNLRELAPMYEYADHGSPMWSPDGKQIVFDAWRALLGESNIGTSHIILADADGTTIKDLGLGALPSFSPDGKKITYSKYPFMQGIWVMNVDGSDVHQIDEEGWSARWSPKKDELVYMCSDGRGTNLRVMDLKTGKHRFLLKDSSEGVYWGMAWSPDGEWVCFNRGMNQIVAVHAEGQEKGYKVLYSCNQDPNAEQVDTHVGWSADGKQVLAAILKQDSPNQLLYRLDFEGKKPPKLLPKLDRNRYYWNLGCSPDGKKIAVSSKPAAADVRAAAASAARVLPAAQAPSCVPIRDCAPPSLPRRSMAKASSRFSTAKRSTAGTSAKFPLPVAPDKWPDFWKHGQWNTLRAQSWATRRQSTRGSTACNSCTGRTKKSNSLIGAGRAANPRRQFSSGTRLDEALCSLPEYSRQSAGRRRKIAARTRMVHGRRGLPKGGVLLIRRKKRNDRDRGEFGPACSIWGSVPRRRFVSLTLS